MHFGYSGNRCLFYVAENFMSHEQVQEGKIFMLHKIMSLFRFSVHISLRLFRLVLDVELTVMSTNVRILGN